MAIHWRKIGGRQSRWHLATRRVRAGIGRLFSASGPAFLGASLVLCASSPSAQELPASLEELLRSEKLERGDAVYVTNELGDRVAGNVRDLSSSALILAAGRDTWTLTENEISAIALRDSVRNGIGWGVAAGLGAYFALCADEGDFAFYCVHSLPDVGLLFAGIGVLAGWTLDYIVVETVYRGPRAARLSISPVVADNGVGAGMTLSW